MAQVVRNLAARVEESKSRMVLTTSRTNRLDKSVDQRARAHVTCNGSQTLCQWQGLEFAYVHTPGLGFGDQSD